METHCEWGCGGAGVGFLRASIRTGRISSLVLGCGFVDAGSADAACWCGDGNTPTLGCCGGDLERICVVDEWGNLSNCPAECEPGLSLRWGVCRNSQSREGDSRRLLRRRWRDCLHHQPNCATGLSVADPTIYDPEFLADCVPPPIPAKTVLNGAAQRPFYVVAHNPNDQGLLDNDLAAGANALEPDITLASDGPA